MSDYKDSLITRNLSPHQPLYAFIDLSIDGHNISYFGNKEFNDSVISLNVERKGTSNQDLAGSTFDIELYDDTALRIEELLANTIPAGSNFKTAKELKDTGNKVTDGNIEWKQQEEAKKKEQAEKDNTYTDEDEKKDPNHKAGTKKQSGGATQSGNVRCKYGWCDRKGQVIEDISLIGKALKYTLAFEGPALTLTLNCVAEADVKTTQKLNMEFSAEKFGGKPSDIVRALCEKAHIKIGRIVETKPILGDDGKPKEFKMGSRTMREFIADELLEKATPTDSDKPGYKFFLQVVDGEEKAFFVPNDMYGDMTVITYKKMEETTTTTTTTTSNDKPSGLSPYQKVMGVSTPILGHTRDTNVSVVGDGKVVFVGDFRVRDLQNAVPDNKDLMYIYDDKANYRWLKDNFELIESKLHMGYRVYFMLGHNDIDNILNYVEFYNKVVKELDTKGVQVFVVSVLPVFMGKTDLHNSNIQRFNNAINQNRVRELHYVNIYSDILKALRSNNTKQDGISYNNRLMQDVYNRIVYYREDLNTSKNIGLSRSNIINGLEFVTHTLPDMLNTNSYQGNVSDDEYYGSFIGVEEDTSNLVALALADASNEDIANLLSEMTLWKMHIESENNKVSMVGILGSDKTESVDKSKLKFDKSKLVNAFIDVLDKKGYTKEVKEYVSLVNTFTDTIKDKKLDTTDKYVNALTMLSSKLGKDSSISKTITNVVKVITENKDKVLNVKDKKISYDDLATDIVSKLLPNQSANISKITDKVSSIMKLDRDKIKKGDYSELEGMLAKELGINDKDINKYVEIGKTISEIYKNREYFDIKDLSLVSTDLLKSVVGEEKVKKVEKYVDTAQNLYKAFSGAKDIKDINSAVTSLSDVLGKNTKINRYIDTARSFMDIINKGSVGTGIINTNNGISKIINDRLPNIAQAGTLGGVVASTVGISPTSTKEVLKAYVPKGVDSGVTKVNGSPTDGTKTGQSSNVTKDGISDEEMKKGVRSVTFGGKKTKMEICGEYEIYTGRPDGRVISFSPEFESDNIATNKVPTSALTIDGVRNEMLECTIEGVGGALASDAYMERSNQEGSGNVGVVLGMSGSSFKNLESSAASMWSRYFSSVYGASLEILGDTRVKFQGHIKIAVYTKYGFLHHTSGIYNIQGITDTISGGMFTTSLDLQKNSDEVKKKKKGKEKNKVDETKGHDVGDGKYWVKQSGKVSLEGAISGIPSALDMLGKWFYDRSGHKLVVTSVTDGDHAYGEHCHANGWKMDVNDWYGPEGLQGGLIINSDDTPGSICLDFIEYGRSIGLGMNFEGDHIDIQMDGTEWNENNPGGAKDNGGFRG